MVVPIIAAGARVAVGSAARGAATRAAAARGTAGRGAAAQYGESAVATQETQFAETGRQNIRRTVQQKQSGSVNGGSRYRVGMVTAIFMVGLAVLVDIAQFFLTLTVLLALGSLFLTFLAASIFFVWFLILGVSYFGGRKAGVKILAAAGGLVAELVPVINALPATTVAVVTVIAISRIEDREKARDAAKSTYRGAP